jgi:succinylarginine dihydrolase
MPTQEYNFDGLVGPTHNYAGLSRGNLASARHEGQLAHPKEAALQGLAKMRLVSSLGAGQAVLPPHPRPSLRTLRALGFHGSDEEVIARAATSDELLLRLCSSASAMWAANAATCAPSEDASDRRVHLTAANLNQMFHRAIEADTTFAVLRRIFADEERFAVHHPLPGAGQFADEGAANHIRLQTAGHRAVHLFAWGRSAFGQTKGPERFPARQTLEASQAIARLHRLSPTQCLFPQQSPEAIDAGAFHTDVLAVGNEGFLMLHQRAFVDPEGLLSALRERLGPQLKWAMAREDELALKSAVAAYPFNSQLLTLPDRSMAILAPTESRELEPARRFLESVSAVHYLDVRQSMKNGGGPACLRLRIWLTEEERAAVSANVFFTPELDQALQAWVDKHYRDRLSPGELADPLLARESMTALDELTQILQLGTVYDFQKIEGVS